MLDSRYPGAVPIFHRYDPTLRTLFLEFRGEVSESELVEAAAKLASLWPAGERAPAKVDQRGAPDITWVARLGAAASETNAPPKPLYLRPPDAHPQDAVQLARR